MKRRLGLKARFIGLILILLTTIFAITAVVVIRIDAASLRQELQNRSKTFATLATTPIGNSYLTYQNSGTYLIGKQIATFQALDPTITNIAIVGLDGSSVFDAGNTHMSVSTADASTFEPAYKYNDGVISRIIYPYIGPNGNHSYAVVYDISSTEIDHEVMHLANSIILDSLLGLLVSAAVTYWLITQLFLNPIKRLRDKTVLIAAGHYDEQITTERHDEIGDLGSSVNRMAEGLKADIQKLKEVDKIKSEFMMIASHNLRTPLTVIDGYISLAKSQTLSGPVTDILLKIEANSKRLGIFAEDLLTISDIEAGQEVFATEQVDVGKILQSIAGEFTVLAHDKNVRFAADIADDGIVLGSQAHLRSAIWNLLDNALKFTPENGQINLSLHRVGNNLQLAVSDTGIGIAPEEIGKLFTKFHRGTSTLRYDYEGTGLGLYVTKLIITQHKGSINVESELGKGSTFTVTLPIATSENVSSAATESATAPAASE